MALEMQNFEALSPPVVKKITWWTLVCIQNGLIYNIVVDNENLTCPCMDTLNSLSLLSF